MASQIVKRVLRSRAREIFLTVPNPNLARVFPLIHQPFSSSSSLITVTLCQTAEADMQQLSHALKILSETEKQLRTSKNQTTWLTVALLQLNSVSSSSLNANETRLCARTLHTRDGDLCSTSYITESLKHLVTCACDNYVSYKMGIQDGKGTLESVWNRATEICESNSLRNFLQKKGKLASICFNEVG